MSDCESTRGEWGGICPDCGQRLPQRKDLTSWKAARPLVFPSGASAGLGDRTGTRHAAYRSLGNGMTERQIEVSRIVDKHGGSHAAAARELGIARATVSAILKRASDSIRP